MGAEEGRRLRAVFPAGVWAADVEGRYPPSSRARMVAEQARRAFERDGIPRGSCRHVSPGTRGGPSSPVA